MRFAKREVMVVVVAEAEMDVSLEGGEGKEESC